MAVTQYIGARYVPLFADPLQWDNTRTYEPLTIVQHQGNSYTSRQAVPTGIDITNEAYWALTGNYNAQIEQYRQEVQSFDERITANTNKNTEQDNEIADVTALAHTNEEDIASLETDVNKINKNLLNGNSYVKPNFVGRTYVDKNTVGNVSCQASCWVEGKIITTFQKSNDNTTLVKVSDASQTTIATQVEREWGHANSLCYDGEDLLVVPMSNYNGSSSTGRISTIIICDPNTLNEKDRISFPNNYNPYSITFDWVTEKYYVTAAKSTDSTFTVFSWNKTENTATQLFTITGTSNDGNNIFQGVSAYGGYLVACYSNPNYAVIIDETGKTLKCTYLSEEWGYYEAYEMESITFDRDGFAYVSSPSYLYGCSLMYNVVASADIFRGSMFTIHDEATGYAYPNHTYADSSVSKNVFNPNGSNSNPYPTLTEAIMCYINNKFSNIITVKDNSTFTEEIRIPDAKGCMIFIECSSAGWTLNGHITIDMSPKVVIWYMNQNVTTGTEAINMLYSGDLELRSANINANHNNVTNHAIRLHGNLTIRGGFECDTKSSLKQIDMAGPYVVTSYDNVTLTHSGTTKTKYWNAVLE